ncbi:hypothetical protein N431DRAFT_482418 [Stipitochalara longipes BDJ]|nr:hypothetical protein N431DRAFT_482418 [Stipitochalara longipes BDJ]
MRLHGCTLSGHKLLVLIGIFILLSYGSHVFAAEGSLITIEPRSSTLDPRENSGDPDAAADIYGLGVRVGFYLQGISQLLHTVPRRKDSGRGVKLACASVSISILASWSVLARDKLFSPSEAYLVTFILNSVNIPATMTLINSDAIAGEGIGLVLSLVALVWGVTASTWTSAVLYRTLPRLETGNVVWFFAKVSVTGWFRVFWLVVASMAWLILLSQVRHFLRVGWITSRCYLQAMDDLPEDDKSKAKSKDILYIEEMFANSLSGRILAKYSVFIFSAAQLVAGSFIWCLLIVSTEKTILLNHLSPTTDLTLPGQLIPLLTGIAVAVDGVLFLCRPPRGQRERAIKRFQDCIAQLDRLRKVLDDLKPLPSPSPSGKPSPLHDVGGVPDEIAELLVGSIWLDVQELARVLGIDDGVSWDSRKLRMLKKAWKRITWDGDQVQKDLDRLESSVEKVRTTVADAQERYIRDLQTWIRDSEGRIVVVTRESDALDMEEIPEGCMVGIEK